MPELQKKPTGENMARQAKLKNSSNAIIPDPHINEAVASLVSIEQHLVRIAELIAQAEKFGGQARCIDHCMQRSEHVKKLRGEIVAFYHRDRERRGLK